MLRILSLLATVATAATLSGGANAHPPDIATPYGASSHARHSYAPVYSQPTTHSQPRRYSRPAYVQPSYDAVPLYSRTYSTPRYRPRVRRAPAYTSPVYDQPTYTTVPVSSYAGYTNPGYGYRHRRGHAQPRALRYVPPHHPNLGGYSRTPMTESVSYGYSGGPTFGNDVDAVINGVRIFRNRD